jgi:AbiV family abortive infection protein
MVLALFAQEELGRWSMLRDLRKKVLDEKHLTVKKIQDHCGDHVSRQRAGMMSTTMRADRCSVLGNLLMTLFGSIGWSKARQQIEKLDRLKAKRIPSDRHQQRISALYVDAVAPDRWNRPIKEISATPVDCLQEAANDYSMQYDRYTNSEIYKPDDPEFYTALEKWTGRPTLACPERPLLPP